MWKLELMHVMCGSRDSGFSFGFTLIPGFAVTKRGTPESDFTPATRPGVSGGECVQTCQRSENAKAAQDDMSLSGSQE